MTLFTLFQIPPSLILLLLSTLPTSSSQFLYPPNVPNGKALSDYTSGRESPILDFVIHDAIIGNYFTPKPAFSITRCAQQGRTAAIEPSGLTFNSSRGRVAADGTWQVMDSHSNGMFENVYNSGKNLWIIPDFEDYVGNATTGHVCWWELYSVEEVQTYDYSSEEGGIVREVTLLGNDTDNYFASTPFIVQTAMRDGNRNFTWRSGGGSDNRASSTTIAAGNRPTGNAAPRWASQDMLGGGILYTAMSVLGIFL